jgi:hypothetical protein
MSANNIAETSTSTGTGNITLAGAWSQAGTYNIHNNTFHSFFGANHVFDYEIRDLLGNREKGEGYLSNATTLVRLNVFTNSLGTTAKINFPAGEKIVFVPTDARAFGSRMMNKVNYSLAPNFIGVRGEITMVPNRLYVAPHLVAAPCKLSTIAHTITQGAVGSLMRVGIYNLTKQSDTGQNYDSTFPLLIDFGTVDTATAAIKAISCDINLAQGVYGIAVISNGAPRIMSGSTNLIDLGIPANTYQSNPVSHWYNDGASQFTALPANTFGAMSAIMNTGAPVAMFKGGIL